MQGQQVNLNVPPKEDTYMHDDVSENAEMDD